MIKKKCDKNDDYWNLQETMKHDFDRVLPYGELRVDRWEKAKFCGFGNDTSVYDSAIIMGDVKVGNNVWIGPNTLLDGSGACLLIGDYCSISADVHIYTHDTIDFCLSGGKVSKKTGGVTIGSFTYIAPKVIISMGISLGNHCLVCTNSFVNDSFSDNSIVAGTPAKKIGEVIITEEGEVVRKYYSEIQNE